LPALASLLFRKHLRSGRTVEPGHHVELLEELRGSLPARRTFPGFIGWGRGSSAQRACTSPGPAGLEPSRKRPRRRSGASSGGSGGAPAESLERARGAGRGAVLAVAFSSCGRVSGDLERGGVGLVEDRERETCTSMFACGEAAGLVRGPLEERRADADDHSLRSAGHRVGFLGGRRGPCDPGRTRAA